MDKAAEMQISVEFLDPDLFTSTNIFQHSRQVSKAISKCSEQRLRGGCLLHSPLGNSDHLYEVQRGLVSRFC
jgi:hypothetical protein